MMKLFFMKLLFAKGLFYEWLFYYCGMTRNLPDIYYFNPTCEYAVANGGKHWQPNRLLQKMEADLTTLPLFLANQKDIVLVKKSIPDAYMNALQKCGYKTPQFKLLNDALASTNFKELPKNKLMPWGCSPAVHQLLSPLKPSCSEEFKSSPVSTWKPEYRDIYSKKYSLGILTSIVKNLNSSYLLPQDLLPEVCTSKNDFENLIKKWGKIMVKAPWSSSGRGLQPVTKTPVHPKVWEKLLGIVNEQGYAVSEPYLDKILDMAFQFEMKKGKAKFLGTSFFSTDKKGQYQKSYINGLPENTDNSLLKFVKNAENLIIPILQNEIEQSLISRYYEGFLGVDTLVFLDKNQQLKINPCLEINVRQNMGLLSLKLKQFLPNEKKGVFSLFFQPGTSFKKFADKMKEKHPLQLQDEKIESGFFPLTPSTDDALFGAYLIV